MGNNGGQSRTIVYSHLGKLRSPKQAHLNAFLIQSSLCVYILHSRFVFLGVKVASKEIHLAGVELLKGRSTRPPTCIIYNQLQCTHKPAVGDNPSVTEKAAPVEF